ncbi:T9SS type A sorting domain-containing protein [Chitinophaga cymbidii]|nr:T9SS type A sorting domain-containing protein [Chitinophaga cymbidii]
MKYLFLTFICLGWFHPAISQCTVDIGEDEFQPICYTPWGTYATMLAPWAIEEPGWTYSWSPAIGLDNPNTLNAMANPSATITYTLTVTAPGCGTFIGGTYRVEVMPNTPTITPTGPITHYYSDTNDVILTSNAPYGGWYKNGVLVQGCCDDTYTVNFSGSSNTTDYYRFYSPYSCNYWSNIIEVNYIGCGMCRVTTVNDKDSPAGPKDEKLKAIEELASIQLFPNPVSSRLTISSKSPITNIDITNISGAIVKKLDAGGATYYSFNVDELPGGYYICTLKTANGIKQIPFVVTKR